MLIFEEGVSFAHRQRGDRDSGWRARDEAYYLAVEQGAGVLDLARQ